MPKKYYAVRKGKTTGIFTTWEDCKKQVAHVSGAEYKSFPTEGQARAYLENTGDSSQPHAASPENSMLPPQGNASGDAALPMYQELQPDSAVAYVDGSYRNDTKSFSYGVVFFHQGEELHLSRKVEDPSLVSMRNVAGEIKGAQASMELALERGVRSLTIFHDYEGIARWCTGEWKATKAGTQAYKHFFDSIKDRLGVRFVKVRGHSNDRYNDLADSLAKKAIFR